MTAAGHAMCDAPACRLIKFPVASIPQALHVVHPVGASLLPRENELGAWVGPHSRRPGERPRRVAQHLTCLTCATEQASVVMGVAHWVGSVPYRAGRVCQGGGRGVREAGRDGGVVYSASPADFARFESQLPGRCVDGGGPSLVRADVEDGRDIGLWPLVLHLIPRGQRAPIRETLARGHREAAFLRRGHHRLVEELLDLFEALVERLQVPQPRQRQAAVRPTRAFDRSEGVCI